MGIHSLKTGKDVKKKGEVAIHVAETWMSEPISNRKNIRVDRSSLAADDPLRVERLWQGLKISKEEMMKSKNKDGWDIRRE